MRNALVSFAALGLLFSISAVRANSRAGVRDDSQSDHEWSKTWTVSPSAELRLQADRGSVHVSQIAGNSIHAVVTTNYWRISESEVEISSTQDSSGVEIRIRVPEEHFHFFHHDASVDIDLQVPAGSRLALRTGFGHVSCDFPITVTDTRRRSSINGRIGSGGSPINIDTGFGSVHIRKL